MVLRQEPGEDLRELDDGGGAGGPVVGADEVGDGRLGVVVRTDDDRGLLARE